MVPIQKKENVLRWRLKSVNVWRVFVGSGFWIRCFNTRFMHLSQNLLRKSTTELMDICRNLSARDLWPRTCTSLTVTASDEISVAKFMNNPSFSFCIDYWNCSWSWRKVERIGWKFSIVNVSRHQLAFGGDQGTQNFRSV